MTDPAGWPLEHHRGPAAPFHGRNVPDPAQRAVWWFEVTGPAIALGSTQRLDVVDAAAATDAGVEVLRRRSGGGAVWLSPSEVTWVDVILPTGDPLWEADVGRSAAWLGRVWQAALGDVGVAGTAAHDGPLRRTPASELVCFAGVAPGELTVDGRKVLGISQRRTRAGARFQCAVLHRWDPDPLVDLLALAPDARTALRAEVAEAATGIGPVSPAELVAALRTHLVLAG